MIIKKTYALAAGWNDTKKHNKETFKIWHKLIDNKINNNKGVLYAVLTGKINNITVIDLDILKAENRNEEFENLVQSAETFQVSTPKGEHHYFLYCPYLKNKIGFLGYIDILNDTKCVIGAGTLRDDGFYSILEENELKPISKALFDFIPDNLKNDFEKDYYKLMNNAVFGKTMENVRNRVQVKLPTTLKKAQKYTNSPNCTKWEIIDENMPLVSLKEKNVKLDKPIYAGFSILDLSKYLMYDFYYNIMKPKYGQNLKLLATDTDSFFFAVYTEDLYKDIWDMREHFDMSEYSKENPLYDETNKKVIGKFKDELGDNIMSEFIGVRPKCYSYKKHSIKDGYKNIKKLKGVPSSIVKTDIKHEDYDKCVSENKPLSCKVHGIRSSKLQNYAIQQVKTALSNTDDKRYWDLSLGYQSLALGHRDIK
ncbi:hypothetical protein GUITHDRAFT_175438 [Guillardia theta CCMP2712]|uniref:DNA primase/polymerase bifunctional N-terminal domain-containing protein n=1 Tax=Guillardia theta (strain CCMP2712) TaxID=905079 RepID=L1IW57_GUITC|nr:hypothetical protein GUITHDRAFT_175438 [Guillardia theta CCMP2712]EKX40498.1 hypothetical protein GUITHDRAFT_175438 [Guillardia theta CCMP2712]|eukprot:XP_005827478.1 hypothetical protein GUITHDRAFT_175438 [Guillardia theta CCMP2712]